MSIYERVWLVVFGLWLCVGVWNSYYMLESYKIDRDVGFKWWAALMNAAPRYYWFVWWVLIASAIGWYARGLLTG